MARPPLTRRTTAGSTTLLQGRVLGCVLGCVLGGALGWAGCSDSDPANPAHPTKPAGQTASGPVILYHDYGILDLGTKKTTDLDVPVPVHANGDVVVDDEFRGNCSCIIGMLMIQRKAGSQHPVFGLPADQRVVHPGDKVILRLTIDTRNEEAKDVKKLESRGHLGFQLNSSDFARYETVVVRFQYGIRTPVKVSPVAHIDFGELPRSRTYPQELVLENNVEGQKLQLGAPQVSHDTIDARLENVSPDKAILHVKITPNFDRYRQVRSAIMIPTGLELYPFLTIPVTGTFCSDIQYFPAENISFGLFDFTKSRDPRMVTVIDHDTSRPKGFVLHAIRDSHGNDISKHFEVSFKSLSGRKTRVLVKYLGTMGGMRMIGELTLAKKQGGEPLARLTLLGHNTRK